MSKIKVAIVGYGNIGKSALKALEQAKDFDIVGLVEQSPDAPKSINIKSKKVKLVDNIKKLDKVDIAIVCVPSKMAPDIVKEILSLGINTVDSYDIHSSIWETKKNMDPIAKKNKKVSIISAGWDPGSDSIIRALFMAAAPIGITYTNFGPGMSMGHTVAAKSIDGVKSALSMTIPLGTGIHRRVVYIELEEDSDFNKIQKLIKNNDYFKDDETHVIKVDNIEDLMDMGHGVNMVRKGVSGQTHNQRFEFNMSVNNPALTGQILVSAA